MPSPPSPAASTPSATSSTASPSATPAPPTPLSQSPTLQRPTPHHPLQNNFAQARNAVLQNATADWILFLDADEILDPQAVNLIPHCSQTNLSSATTSPSGITSQPNQSLLGHSRQANPHRLPAAQSFAAYVEHKNVRLARRHPEIFFEKRVHEGVADRMHRLASKSPKPPTASFTISESPKIPPNSASAKTNSTAPSPRKTNRLP